jgi:hypothetical protein
VGKTIYNSSLNDKETDENITFWDQGNGIKHLPVGRDMNSDELYSVLNIMERGVLDKEYIGKTLNSLTSQISNL